MDLFIDRAGPMGLCAQLYEQFREGIAAGRLQAEDAGIVVSRLPAGARLVYLAWCREHGVQPDGQIFGVTDTGGNP